MKDGSALPDWIKVNPKTGVVVTDIPSNIDVLEFKVIGIDDRGRVKLSIKAVNSPEETTEG